MRNLIILLGLIGVGAVAYFGFIFEKDGTSLHPAEINFSISDTAAIQSITMTRVVKGEEKQQISLERQANSTWMLNDQYPAFTPRLRNLLKALHVMQVQKVLPDPGLKSGKRLINVMHTRVEVRLKGGGRKTYLVGTQTKDATGTLMQLADAETPFVVEIPGLQGYLNTYFPMGFDLWRENLLFQGQQDFITRISIQYASNPASGFVLQRGDLPDEWAVAGVEVAPSPEALQAYLFQYKGPVYAESFAAQRFPDVLERLKAQTPDITMELRYEDGPARRFFLFYRDDNPNNYFAYIEGKDELLTVQKYVIDQYLAESGDFFRTAL